MNSKKYELTDTTKPHPFQEGVVLHQIRALRDIPRFGVKSGDVGGWIEKEANLAQDGDAWVSGDARVSGGAWVYGDARVFGGAWVYGGARVFGGAWVFGDARVSGGARVSGDAWVYGDARVSMPGHILTIRPVGSENKSSPSTAPQTATSAPSAAGDPAPSTNSKPR